MTQCEALETYRLERRLALQAARRGDLAAVRAHNAAASRYFRMAWDAHEREVAPHGAPPCELDEAREFRGVGLVLDLMAY